MLSGLRLAGRLAWHRREFIAFFVEREQRLKMGAQAARQAEEDERRLMAERQADRERYLLWGRDLCHHKPWIESCFWARLMTCMVMFPRSRYDRERSTAEQARLREAKAEAARAAAAAPVAPPVRV